MADLKKVCVTRGGADSCMTIPTNSGGGMQNYSKGVIAIDNNILILRLFDVDDILQHGGVASVSNCTGSDISVSEYDSVTVQDYDDASNSRIFYILSNGTADIIQNGHDGNGYMATFILNTDELVAYLAPTEYEIGNAIENKQDALVSGTNIKTINNQSLLGSGNITIEGGGSVDPATIIDLVYPIGSIYTSVNSTSPATLFGGTWEQITDYSAGSATIASNWSPSFSSTYSYQAVPFTSVVNKIGNGFTLESSGLIKINTTGRYRIGGGVQGNAPFYARLGVNGSSDYMCQVISNASSYMGFALPTNALLLSAGSTVGLYVAKSGTTNPTVSASTQLNIESTASIENVGSYTWKRTA